VQNLPLRSKQFSLEILRDDIQPAVGVTRNDTAAFDALYHKYHNAVYANIFKLIKQQEAAEDVLQDVFTALWESRKKIDHEKSVGGWLFVVSYNKALKFLHKTVREKMGALEETALIIAEDPDNERRRLEYKCGLINEAIERLPPQKKLVFTLCKLEGKTYKEAAREAGISTHTVKEYVSAASKYVKAYSLRQYTLNAPLSLPFLIAFLSHL
jgi:RNA polymerase sigma-70 factor (family 1)